MYCTVVLVVVVTVLALYTVSFNMRSIFSKVNTKISDALQDNKVDAVICVAGGWAGGNASSKGEILCTPMLMG